MLRPLRLKGRWADDKFLQRVYVIGLLTVVPILLYLTFGKPVGLLKLAGAIEAAHIPVLAGLILYLNHRALPADLRPSWPTFVVTALAGIFFALFAMVYLYQLVAPAG